MHFIKVRKVTELIEILSIELGICNIPPIQEIYNLARKINWVASKINDLQLEGIQIIFVISKKTKTKKLIIYDIIYLKKGV